MGSRVSASRLFTSFGTVGLGRRAGVVGVAVLVGAVLWLASPVWGQNASAPEITSTGPFDVDEGVTAVATLVATDTDTDAGDLEWSITAGADQSHFTLTDAGELSFAVAKDFENPGDSDSDGVYEVSVSVSDGTDSDTAAVTVTVTNVIELTTLAGPADVEHSENWAGRVATYSASSAADAAGLVWSVSGVDAARFSIDDPGGALRFSIEPTGDDLFLQLPDFDDPLDDDSDGTYEVTVHVEGGGDQQTLDVEVTVTDAPEPGTLALSSTRPQLGDTLTTTLTDPDGVTGAVTYVWERSVGRGTWVTLADTAASRVPTAADTGHFLRVTATYQDGHAAGNTATARTSEVVTADRLTALTVSTTDSTANPGHALRPSFDAGILHYSIGCATSDTMTLAATAGTGVRLSINGTQVTSGESHTAAVEADSEVRVALAAASGAATTYFVRCLSGDLLDMTATTASGATGVIEDLIMFGVSKFGEQSVAIVDANGAVRFHRKNAEWQGGYFRAAWVASEGGYRYFYNKKGGGQHWQILDQNLEFIANVGTVAPLTKTDNHDAWILENGNYVLFSYEPADRDLSGLTFGNFSTSQRVLDAAIQIRTPDGTSLFDWNSYDAIPLEDCKPGFPPQQNDYAHINTVQMVDGHIVASFRGCSTVLRIDPDLATGDKVVWRLALTNLSDEQWDGLGKGPPPLDIIGDAEGQFCGQHGSSVLPNGHLILFDNGRLCMQDPWLNTQLLARPGGDYSRAVEYALDLDNGEAVFLRDHSLGGTRSRTGRVHGHVEALDNGDWLIGWGAEGTAKPYESVTQVDPNTGEEKFSIALLLNANGSSESIRPIPLPPVALADVLPPLEASIVAGAHTSTAHEGAAERPTVAVAFNRPAVDFAAATSSVSVADGSVEGVAALVESGAPAHAYVFTLVPDGDADIGFSLVAGQGCDSDPGGVCTADNTTLSVVPAASHTIAFSAPTPAGVSVSESALTVTEQDTTGDTYTVVLDTEPTANVTVTVGGHAGSDVTVNPTSLTFTSLDWSTAQTVTVTAGNDADLANETVTLTHSAASSDSDYSGVLIAGVTVTVSDNDTAQVTGVMVAPGDAQLVVRWTAVSNATGYRVQWKSGAQGYNTGNRQAVIASGSTTSHTIGSLTNGTEYTLRVTAVRVGANDGPPSAEVTGIPAVPTPAGVSVSESELTVTEQDTTGDTYTVVLDTEPTANVTVTVGGHAGSDVTVNPTSLTFTSLDWSTAQTVTVTAGNDADLANETVTLTHSAASSDSDYSGVSIAGVTVTVSDNDTAQVTGVMVAPGDAQLVVRWTAVSNATGYRVQWKSGAQGYNTGNRQAVIASGSTTSHTIGSLTNGTEYTLRVTAVRVGANDGPPSAEVTGIPAVPTAAGVSVSESELTVTEQDTTGDTYTVVLDTEPTANVTVTVGGHAGSDVTVNPTSLTFTSLDWSTAQTVTVTAGNDADLANETVTLTHSAASSDSDYSGVLIAGVTVTVSDNDTAQVTGVMVAPGDAQLVVRWTAVSNATGYRVQWKSGAQGYNTGNRQAVIASGSTTSHTIGSLTNGTEYTLRVTAVRVGANDGPPSAEVTGIPAVPTPAGVSVSESALTVTEQDTTGDTYTVVLDTEPTANVTVTVGGHAGSDVTVNPTSLTFTSLDWSTAQTVTVTAGNDADLANETVTLTHSAASSDSDYSGVSIAGVTVTVSDNDTAVLGFSVDSGEVSEGGVTELTFAITNGVVFAADQTINIEVSGSAGVGDFVLEDSNGPLSAPYAVTLEAGESSVTATLAAVDDSVPELAETVVLTATLASTSTRIGSRTVTIPASDLGVPEVTIVAGGAVTEGADAVFTLHRTVVVGSPLTVPLTVRVQVNATGEVLDGVAASTVTFSADNSSVELRVATVDDTVVEDTATVRARVLASNANPATYEPGAANSAAVTVFNDDDARFTVTASPTRLVEGNTSTVTVQTGGVTFAQPQTLTVDVTGSAVDDDDFELADGQGQQLVSPYGLVLAAGADSVTLELRAVTDDVDDDAETVELLVRHDSQNIGAVTITIVEVNQPPVLAGPNRLWFAENDTAAVATFTATDPEADTITWSLTGADATWFSITAGELQFVAPPDFDTAADTGADNVYDVTVRAADDEGAAERPVKVTVTDIDEAATITTNSGSFTFSHTENSAEVVAVFTAEDPENAPIIWSLAGTDSDDFEISDHGVLTFTRPPDYEHPSDDDTDNEYLLEVWARAGASDPITQGVTVTVNNADEEAVVVLSSPQPQIGTALQATITDPDGVLAVSTWTWQQSTDRVSWTDIAGATTSSYTPTDAGVYLQAVAAYIDGFDVSIDNAATSTAYPTRTAPSTNNAPQFTANSLDRTVAENSTTARRCGSAGHSHRR